MALGEIPGPGGKQENTISRCKRHFNGKKCYHAIWDGFPQFAWERFFFGWTPTGRKWQVSGGLAHFGPLALREIPGPDGKTLRYHFPVLGARLSEKNGTTLSRMVSRNFLGFFFGRTPTGLNSDPVGLWPIFGRAENTKTQFPRARGHFYGEKKITTLPKMVFRNFLGTDFFFLVGPPPAGNSDLVGCWPLLAHFQVPEAKTGQIPLNHRFRPVGV